MMKEKAVRFLKRIKAECGNRETVILFALIVAVMYCPVWGGYLLYAIFRWELCFAVASAYLVFWAGPFTPFFPCCIAITLFLKKIMKRYRKNGLQQTEGDPHGTKTVTGTAC